MEQEHFREVLLKRPHFSLVEQWLVMLVNLLVSFFRFPFLIFFFSLMLNILGCANCPILFLMHNSNKFILLLLNLSVIFQIPLAHYLPTWRGNVIDAELEMNPSRVVGMSLSVNAEGGVPGARSGPGDFRVEIDWIKALRTQWF